nr:MAG TPA: hypothetical protein [Caudoviricetes sp.]
MFSLVIPISLTHLLFNVILGVYPPAPPLLKFTFFIILSFIFSPLPYDNL